MSAAVVSAVSSVSHSAPKAAQGKWGFHVVNYEGFKALKAQHKLVLNAYKELKKYYVWIRKEPKNRTLLSLPLRCPSFCTALNTSNIDVKTWQSHSAVVRADVFALRKMYKRLLKAYQLARIPSKDEGMVPFKEFRMNLYLSGSPMAASLFPKDNIAAECVGASGKDGPLGDCDVYLGIHKKTIAAALYTS